MKKLAVVTATRAEYGLLRLLIEELRKAESLGDYKVDLIVTGTHLSAEYGNTIEEIKEDGLRIDHIVEVPVKSSTDCDISFNQATVLTKFTKLFSEEKYAGIVILGDRYELLMIAVSAMNTHTPIFHLCGGDTTEGAIDESIRHAITKMSYLHFPTNEISRKRIIQLGENPERVFNYGATSVDNILRMKRVSKKEALASIGLEDCRYAICTYHPVTLNNDNMEKLVMDFLSALDSFPQMQFIITKSNADKGGQEINRILDREAEKRNNIHVYSSLGARRYLSLMSHADAVIGNSSSGIMETAVFKVPTVNIGDRQRGRLQADNILNCDSDRESIVSAIKEILEDDFKKKCQVVTNPYGDGNAAYRIANKIIEEIKKTIDLKKSFYSIKEN